MSNTHTDCAVTQLAMDLQVTVELNQEQFGPKERRCCDIIEISNQRWIWNTDAATKKKESLDARR